MESGIAADLRDPIDDKHGGTAPWGRWKQNKPDTVIIYMPIPAGCRGKEVKATISTSKLQVSVRGEERVTGKLCSSVVADESDWQLEDGELMITLQKMKEGWWDRVIAKDTPIDISQFDVQPFALAGMQEHQVLSMRDHIGRMIDANADRCSGAGDAPDGDDEQAEEVRQKLAELQRMTAEAMAKSAGAAAKEAAAEEAAAAPHAPAEAAATA